MMFRLFIILLLTFTTPCSGQVFFDLCQGNNLKLLAEVNDGQFYWVVDGENVGEGNQTIQIDTGTHFIELIAFSGSCSITRRFIAIAEQCITIYMPNAFTPNGDNLNDAFGPVGTIEHYELSIYDQWGNQVYNGDKPWSGNGVSDVYAFQIKYKIKQDSYLLNGRVHLIQ